MRKEIGPIAAPDLIQFAPGLPKTRSGKIMRRILRKIAEDEFGDLGDTSTLADPAVVDDLVNNRQNKRDERVDRSGRACHSEILPDEGEMNVRTVWRTSLCACVCALVLIATAFAQQKPRDPDSDLLTYLHGPPARTFGWFHRAVSGKADCGPVGHLSASRRILRRDLQRAAEEI